MITEDKDEELALFLDMTSSLARSDKNSDVTVETVSSRRRTATENFLYSEKEKSDYEWLLTPPGTPERIVENELNSSNSSPMIHESPEDEAREKSKTTSFGSKVKRPSSGSSKSTSKPSTPTRRSTNATTATTRPATSSRATLTTPRATKSTTTTTRPMSAPGAKPGSRTGTLTSRPSTPTGLTSKATKPIRPRPWEPFEMPGYSTEAPSNLRTTLPDRPSSASSRRPVGSAPSSRSTSIERPIARQPRRQSCSPSKARATIGSTTNTTALSLRGRASNVGEIRNKTIEREVKKLAPLRVTESSGGRGGTGGRGGCGGLSVEKLSSINMALRHMDIRRGSMIGNLRPVMSKVPVSSMYSVRSSGSKGNRPGCSGSSESSVNHKNDNVIDILCLDGSEASDDVVSERSYT